MVIEHLGGDIVQRKEQRDKIFEDFVELCQVGIERVQGVHKGTLFRIHREDKCRRRRHLQGC
jgi:hypothetical protein